MEKDKQRIETVAKAVIDRLSSFGLKPAKLVLKETADPGGWWTHVAHWPAEDFRTKDAGRPSVSVFLDNSLDDKRLGFWFGFDSRSREVVDSLVQQLGKRFAERAHWDDNTLHSDYVEAVGQNDGLALDHEDGESYFGKYDLVASADEEIVTRSAEFIVDVVETADPSFAERRDIIQLKQRKDLSSTDRLQLILARRGQGKFRAALKKIWKGCAVSGCCTTEVLRASHIKPWRCSNDEERLDPHNGLLLSATLDALFDRGLISFSETGKIVISAAMSESERHKLGLKTEFRLRKTPLSPQQKKYLRTHRETFSLG